MNNHSLMLFFAVIALGGVASMMLGLLLLRLTLTRRLKKKLQATGDYWESGTIDFGFINTAIFAWACTMRRVQKLERFQLIYPGLDVRSYANGFERVAAYGTVGGLLAASLGVVFFFIFKL
ncbi:hypothetical protein OQJ46_00885 [Microbulbifer thermotolerans]|uniref:Uncharacterized protein n=1 Tax=Microbulbifer thermotolerans TaxID=252514 RepID=A0AB35I190_MICTH|nr:hypothetical protein [Microbulbifer thermotolerans]MCX2781542.1 hypothetical protein [Microbulbifer thermotolerans]MCX2794699.1 hypothetical protein [Microbulbifer thermotolerans]MCX2802822.1 hypothetical protein [Microbulbifer thermotolerans]